MKQYFIRALTLLLLLALSGCAAAPASSDSQPGGESTEDTVQSDPMFTPEQAASDAASIPQTLPQDGHFSIPATNVSNGMLLSGGELLGRWAFVHTGAYDYDDGWAVNLDTGEERFCGCELGGEAAPGVFIINHASGPDVAPTDPPCLVNAQLEVLRRFEGCTALRQNDGGMVVPGYLVLCAMDDTCRLYDIERDEILPGSFEGFVDPQQGLAQLLDTDGRLLQTLESHNGASLTSRSWRWDASTLPCLTLRLWQGGYELIGKNGVVLQGETEGYAGIDRLAETRYAFYTYYCEQTRFALLDGEGKILLEGLDQLLPTEVPGVWAVQQGFTVGLMNENGDWLWSMDLSP